MAMNGVGAFFDGFNTAYDSVGRVARDAEIAKIARAGVKPLPGQVPPQMARDIQAEIDADPSVAAAAAPQRFEFLGQQYDTAPDEATQTRGRQLAMAGVFEKYGDVGAGMGMRREVRRDQLADEEAKTAPLRRRQLELGVYRDEQAAQDATAARRIGVDQAAFMQKRLTNPDGTKREPTVDDQLAAAQYGANALMDAGMVDRADEMMARHYALSAQKLAAESGQRKQAAGAVAAAAQAGDLQAAIEFWNKYLPTGDRVTSARFDAKGRIVIDRETMDGRKLPTHVMEGGTRELITTLEAFNDPGAALNQAHQLAMESLAKRRDTREAAAAGRAQAEFDAGAGERDVRQEIAQAQRSIIDPKATPAQRQEAQGRLTALHGVTGKTGDKPSDQKLAEYAVSIGMFSDPVKALTWARSSAEKSPTAVRADLVKAAMSAGRSAKQAQAMAEEVMRGLYPAPSIAPSPAGLPSSAGTPAPQGSATSVPPPAQRVVGQTYPTPRGPLIWRGSGWEQPATATAR